MCGATAAQTNLQQQQADFYKTMTDQYQTVFGEDQTILKALDASLAPIIAKGINQEGFSEEEKTALNTSAIEGVSRSYAQAKQALQQDIAAKGGDATSEITSGSARQMSEELASAGATTEATELNQIEQANYATGRQNYMAAVGSEMGVAGQLNPAGFAGATTGAGSAASTTANEIAQENNSVWNSVISGLGGIAGAAVGNLNVGPFGKGGGGGTSTMTT